MARTQYVVGPDGPTSWKIRYGGKEAGPYTTQAAAIKAAVDAAQKEGSSNRDGAQVLVQRPNGEFRTEWTYGKDSYPPRG